MVWVLFALIVAAVYVLCVAWDLVIGWMMAVLPVALTYALSAAGIGVSLMYAMAFFHAYVSRAVPPIGLLAAVQLAAAFSGMVFSRAVAKGLHAAYLVWKAQR